jgi:hypothetical protein
VGWVDGVGWLCGGCANHILDAFLDFEERVLDAFGIGRVN